MATTEALAARSLTFGIEVRAPEVSNESLRGAGSRLRLKSGEFVGLPVSGAAGGSANGPFRSQGPVSLARTTCRLRDADVRQAALPGERTPSCTSQGRHPLAAAAGIRPHLCRREPQVGIEAIAVFVHNGLGQPLSWAVIRWPEDACGAWDYL